MQSNDYASRFVALCAILGAIVLLFISAQSQAPQARASGPALAEEMTPRLPIVVIATPTATEAPPTQVPESTAVPAAPEVVYVVQYVEVPATVNSPPPSPLVTQQRDVAVPAGAVQVYVAPGGGQPVTSSIHLADVEMERPPPRRGESNGQVTP